MSMCLDDVFPFFSVRRIESLEVSPRPTTKIIPLCMVEKPKQIVETSNQRESPDIGKSTQSMDKTTWRV